MFKNLLLAVFTFCFLSAGLFAQKTMSLQECIQYASDNSISMKSAKLVVEDAQLLEKQARLARTPNVSGTISGGFQFGRTIDPTTNSFRNQRITSNSYSVSAGVTLFDGGRINNTIKQSKIDVEAARASEEFQFNNMALNIANAYLQVLNAEEQLENALKRLELTQEQLEITDKMIEAGTLPKNDRLDILAQIARNQQTIVQSRNAIEINYLNLKQLMEMDPSEDIQIDRPNVDNLIDSDPDQFTFEQVYGAALNTQPQIRAEDLRIESANIGKELARANFFPTVSLFGSLSTNYSNLGQRATGEVATFNQSFTATVPDIAPTPFDIFIENEFDVFEKSPYGSQLNENFGQSLGLRIDIPIFSQGRNNIGMQRSELNVRNSIITRDQTRQNLKTNVQTAIANARASKQNLEAAEKTYEANQIAYENAQKRFDLGAINTFELTTAKNNLDISEVDVVVAKYEYVFNLKIVDFYIGKPIKLD